MSRLLGQVPCCALEVSRLRVYNPYCQGCASFALMKFLGWKMKWSLAPQAGFKLVTTVIRILDATGPMKICRVSRTLSETSPRSQRLSSKKNTFSMKLLP